MAGKLSQVYAFVDAAQLRSGLESIGVPWRDLRLMDLAVGGLQGIRRERDGTDMVINRVFVYDAISEDDQPSSDDEAVEQWLRRNNDEMDVHVRFGRLAGDPRKAKGRRQKGVDVQLAVDALTFASDGLFDVALFVTGDADFAPVVEASRDKGPRVAVFCFRSSLSTELREVADRVGYLPEDPATYAGWKLPPTD
jgi:uncharacterized LabA/DUF88 family protein